jgi:RNA polymerase sigma-70 factor, ECF subfamily
MSPNSGGSTSSLLQRARDRDSTAFERLLRIYGPLVYAWARKANLQASDASDILQEVFASVWGRLPEFRGQQGSAFRSWLWTICRNKIHDLYRRQPDEPQGAGGTTAVRLLHELPEDPPLEESREGQEECAELRLRAILEFRETFEKHVWLAFWHVVVEERSPRDVATELGISVWVVYKAKARVLHRIRQEVDGLVRIDS